MNTKGLQTKASDTGGTPAITHRSAADPERADATTGLDAVRRLLRQGQIHDARQLAATLVSAHPDHLDLLRIHELLSVGRSRRRPASGRSTRRELEWLRDPPDEYRGKWVAVIDGQIVAEADSLKELMARLPADLEQPPLAVQIAA